MDRFGLSHSRLLTMAGLVVGIALGSAPGCAAKKKETRTPEECMRHCEAEQCDIGPNATGSDEHFECLEVCADECS